MAPLVPLKDQSWEGCDALHGKAWTTLLPLWPAGSWPFRSRQTARAPSPLRSMPLLVADPVKRQPVKLPTAQVPHDFWQCVCM